MTRVEQFILENQAVILCLLAGICQDFPTARGAVAQAELIREQIKAWRDEETPPSTETPWYLR